MFSARPGFPKILAQHLFSHSDAVVGNADGVAGKADIDLPALGQSPRTGEPHADRVVGVLHILPKQREGRVIDIARKDLQDPIRLNLKNNSVAHFGNLMAMRRLISNTLASVLL